MTVVRRAAAALTLTLAAMAQSAAPSDAEIRRILAQRIDEYRWNVGIVVGVIEPGGRRFVSHGAFDKGDPRPVDADTVFEIGSITKVFTSLLLTDMAQRGEVKLDDPVAKYLPAEVKTPRQGDRAITLADLATHTSGLPRLPGNLRTKDFRNPYAEYTAPMLYDFLGGFQLQHEPGSHWDYSNLGAGLLGHALALRAGMEYEALVHARIAGPLKMDNTAITLTPEMKKRMAVGHNSQLDATPNWDFQVLAGAGALRSNAKDMLVLLAAALGYTPTPLAKPLAAMLDVRRPTGIPGMEQALGWQILRRGGRELVWKDGGTFGFGTFIGFDAKAKLGVAVLSNAFVLTEGQASIDDIGLHLLDTSLPLAVKRQAVEKDPK